MENKRLKVGIFSPYTDIFGGGERFILSIAQALSQKHEVYLYADKNIRKKSKGIFDIPLERIHFLPGDLIRKQNLLKRYNHLCQYDLFFYMTDGSLFFSGASKNFLIIQSPLHIPRINLFNQLKLSNWRIVCYSQFMKNIISQKIGNSEPIFPLPPCVDLPDKPVSPDSKENIILTVGRFFSYPHDKKHDVLLEIFKSAYKKYFSGWKLVIAGGLTEEGGKEVLNKLQEKAKGFPAEIIVNISSAKLKNLYSAAKIYWHAAGFGEDLIAYPEKAEHFGIAPLEAMSYGCVPLVFATGGPKDIITDGIGGYRWNSNEELLDKTNSLINDHQLFEKQSQKARKVAADYSSDKFYEKIEKIISG